MSGAASGATPPGPAPVSVIVPCFRAYGTVERAARAVGAQTRPPRELFLVDDASGDGGRMLAQLEALREALPAPVRVEVVGRQRNGGAGQARNDGWERATQPYVAFLDADDAWHPRKLEMQCAWLAANPDATVCAAHDVVLPALPSEHEVLPEGFATAEITPRMLLVRNRFSMTSAVVRADAPHRFAPDKRLSEDYYLWLRLAHAGARMVRLELKLSYLFRPQFSTGGASAALWNMELAELDNFRRLHEAGQLSALGRGVASAWALTKFVRRLGIVGARRMRARAVAS